MISNYQRALVHCSTLATSMEKVIDLEAEDFLANVRKTGKIKKEGVNHKEEKENRGEDDCYEIDHIEFYGKLFLNTSSDADEDEEMVVLGTKEKVAVRDFPHPRHLCGNFPFDSTPHENYCSKCYCVLCEVVAPCSTWNGSDAHCNKISNNR